MVHIKTIFKKCLKSIYTHVHEKIYTQMYISVLRVRFSLSGSGDGILWLFMAQSVKLKK